MPISLDVHPSVYVCVCVCGGKHILILHNKLLCVCRQKPRHTHTEGRVQTAAAAASLSIEAVMPLGDSAGGEVKERE